MATTTSHYNFGIEIEAVVKPYGGLNTYTRTDWYRLLAKHLQNRDIEAVHDEDGTYRKHPEYYSGKWFVTRDGSIQRDAPYGEFEHSRPRRTFSCSHSHSH
jgi:hypothetical protein